MIATAKKVKTVKTSVLTQSQDTPYEWAIEYLCSRYGEGKISARNTEETAGVAAGIFYGSKLTKKGGMTIAILLDANGCYRARIDGVLMLAAAYSLNAIENKEEALQELCDQADACAREHGLTIPVGKNNG